MTMFEYTPSGTSRMTRRKLFDGVAMSSLALSSVGTVVASASLAIRSDSMGNFVFFETGQPHEIIAAQLIDEGIEIARAFPPFDHWSESPLVFPQKMFAHATRSKSFSGERDRCSRIK